MKKVPFPQANTLELIFKVLFDIGQDGITKFDVSKKYEIDERQGSYYLDALMFIGLVEKYNIKYFLTQSGVDIRLAPADDARSRFSEKILDNPFLGRVYKDSLKISDREEKKNYIANCIFTEYGLNFNTSSRRASSILSWFDWIEKYGEKNEQ